MPELPEVETIRRGLLPALVGRRVTDVWRSDAALRKSSPLPLRNLIGQTVRDITRHAKVLRIILDQELVVHLGMTGKILMHPSATPRVAHTHVVLELDNGTAMHYIDPRRFGWVALHPGPSPDTDHYGMDALDPKLNDAHLEPLLKASHAPLKSFLLDQTKVAGLGNIYACEALWRARLSPRRKASNTPASSIGLLRQSMVDVLEDSLAAGGTSFNDYVDSIGREGSFLFDVAVFRREGEPCPRCGPGSTVRRIVQSGRSTFYCGGCQR